MEIDFKTLEEFRQMDAEEFFFQKTFNNVPSGFGKTWKMSEVINKAVFEYCKKVMFCLPNHLKIEDAIHDFEEYCDKKDMNVNYVHLKGKAKLCLLGSLQEIHEEAYLNGCRECEHFHEDVCPYWKQHHEAERAKVIFIVPEHLVFVDKYEPDVLIVDESIESFVYSTIEVPYRLRNFVDFEDISCENCPNKDGCRKSRKRLARKFPDSFKCVYRNRYSSVEISDFEVMDIREHFFKYALETNDRIYAIWENGNYRITGRFNLLDYIRNIETLIFNCATTGLDTAMNVFGDFDIVIQSEKKLKNDVYIYDEFMTKKRTKEFVENGKMEEYIELLGIPTDNKTLFYTKIDFEKEISKKYPLVETDHYGNSRGFNFYQHCDCAVLVGRFGFTPEHKALLKIRGETDESIERMEQAEEIQAFNRARPHLDDNVEVYLFTNSLKDIIRMEKEPILFNETDIEKFRLIMENSEEYEGMRKTELYEEISGNNQKIKRMIRFGHELGYFNDMSERGAKLEIL